MIENNIGAPVQLFLVPVTERFAIIGVLPVLVAAVNAAMLPDPLARRLIAVLLFVQLNVTPGSAFEVKLINGIGSPEQTTIDVTELTTGVVLIVIEKVLALAPTLAQLFLVAVTTIVPTKSVPVLLAGAV